MCPLDGDRYCFAYIRTDNRLGPTKQSNTLKTHSERRQNINKLFVFSAAF